jgi:hypothetical protein
MKNIIAAISKILIVSLFVLADCYSNDIKAGQKNMNGINSDNSTVTLYQLWRTYRAEQYIQPSSLNIENAALLFSNLLNAMTHNNVKKLKELIEHVDPKAQFDIFDKTILDESFIVVAEKKRVKSGGGFYVFRRDGNGMMLQAPHAFKDLHSGSLAIKLMQEGNYSGLAINTVPRRYEHSEEKINADLAHINSSYFLTASLAFARFFPDGQIIQLHGYNSSRRDVTRNTNMIISAGTKRLVSQIIRHQSCLIKTLTNAVFVFPKDINVLGGTTNTIGKALRKIGYSGFRHIEMNLSLRKEILTSQIKREFLTECLTN